MARGTILISNAGQVEAPNSYTLPASMDFEPTAITALFEGSGASGDFLAALSLYSQSGELLGRTFPSQTVTAGDDVRVTYSPFALPDSSAGPASAGLTVTAWAYLYDGATTAASGFPTPVPFENATVYDPDGSFNIDDTGTRLRLQVFDAGWYLIELEVIWDNALTNLPTLNLNISTEAKIFLPERTTPRTVRGFTDPTVAQVQRLYTKVLMLASAGTALIDPLGTQTDGVNRGLSGNFLAVQRVELGDSALWVDYTV